MSVWVMVTSQVCHYIDAFYRSFIGPISSCDSRLSCSFMLASESAFVELHSPGMLWTTRALLSTSAPASLPSFSPPRRCTLDDSIAASNTKTDRDSKIELALQYGCALLSPLPAARACRRAHSVRSCRRTGVFLLLAFIDNSVIPRETDDRYLYSIFSP
jgi:hypothetical protein